MDPASSKQKAWSCPMEKRKSNEKRTTTFFKATFPDFPKRYDRNFPRDGLAVTVFFVYWFVKKCRLLIFCLFVFFPAGGLLFFLTGIAEYEADLPSVGLVFGEFPLGVEFVAGLGREPCERNRLVV